MKKIIISLSAIVLVAVAATLATRAYFSSQATATGNTFTAGTLNLAIAQDSNGTPVNGWLNSQNASWNFSAMVPGGTPSVSSVWLKNIGSINGLHLGISAANTESPSGFEKQVRITSLTLGGSNLLSGGAGAIIPAYVAPTNCTVTVSGTKITAAVAAVASGAVICVAPGDYNAAWEGVSQIIVNKGVTVVSTGGPSVTSSVPFSVTAGSVTIRGFNITDPGGSYGVQITNGSSNVSVKDNNINNIGTALSSGSAQGISLQNGSTASSNFTFSGNTITNIGNLSLAWDGNSGSGTSAKGIYIGDTSSAAAVTGVIIQNNIISQVKASTAAWTAGRGAYGILTNVKEGVTNLVVMNNSIYNLEGLWSHAVGLEGKTPNASVTYNDIHDLVDHKGNTDAVGVQVENPNSSMASITINNNNFTPNVAIGINNVATPADAVNGQNNWWGDQDPSNQISGSVNTTGFLGGPVAGLINGTDQNSNGYADLQDLRLTPILNAPLGLNAGEQKQLVMGVQVDGPTTGNTFQGANLTTTLTFTLNQQ